MEIREQVGEENFFLFGMLADEVMQRRMIHDHAQQAINADPRLGRALEALRDGTFSPEDPGRYTHIADNLTWSDYFLVCSDFTDYWARPTGGGQGLSGPQSLGQNGGAQYRALRLVLL